MNCIRPARTPFGTLALGTLALVMMMAIATPSAEASTKAHAEGPLSVIWLHRDGPTPLNERFQGELDIAKAKGQQVITIFTADWCTPCRALKALLEHDPTVQKAAAKGRFVFIDVDEWRGPAHRLIPGVNPTKLPSIVRVDYEGALVVLTFGSKLGLLSPDETAANLVRLIAGQEPAPVAYDANPTERRELSRAQALAKKEASTELKRATLTVIRTIPSWPWSLHEVRLELNNPDARKRFFAVPLVAGEVLREKSDAQGWALERFAEHVRATWFRITGETSFAVIPVGGHGHTTLDHWLMRGHGALPDTLEVWQLSQLRIDGDVQQFDRKQPYALHIDRGAHVRTLKSDTDGATVELRVDRRDPIVIVAAQP